jgi:hypothetical protein
VTNPPTRLYPASRLDKPKLRVGVFLDGWTVDRWVADVLESVRDSGIAELTTVILNCEAPPPKRNSVERLLRIFTGRSKGLGTLLWFLYVHLDRRLRSAYNEPFSQVSIRQLLSSAREIAVVPRRKGAVHRFEVEDVEAVRSERLDVILRFGFNILRGDILSASTFGVWSYHHGDNNVYRGGPAGFWEMYEQNELTGTILQILTEELDGGKVIYRTYGATRSFESLLVNRFEQYRKAIPFVARCLRRAYEQGAAGIPAEAVDPTATPRLYRTPRNSEMMRFILRGLRRMIAGRIRSRIGIEPDHWFLALGQGVEVNEPLAGRLHAIRAPRGRFWADPILARGDDGRTHLFFEDYDYRTRLGHISVAQVDEQARLGPVHTALETEGHLSYPFVFEWGGAHYMVPESASERVVRLYRAVKFPCEWEPVAEVLTGVNAVDATLCEHQGHWYMFAGISESGGSTWDELFLFVSRSPTGPWDPHPMNPIVSDVRRARPAGALFISEGRLIRPGQNSARSYGHALVFSEVTELSPERYAEQPFRQINPEWMRGIHGCHTISMMDNLIALDAKKTAWRP